MDWQLIRQKTLVQTPPFAVEELEFLDPQTQAPLPHLYYRIAAASWVNVFALTSEGHAILVKQPRTGLMQTTLEIPGGNMDAGELPAVAAARELEEETGYRAGELHFLGTISPNPAIMNNHLHMFMATNCSQPAERQHFPDAMEKIEVLTLPVPQLEDLMRRGQFQNALGALTVLTALRYGEPNKTPKD